MKNKKGSFVFISILFISAYSFSQATVEDVNVIEPNVYQELTGTWSWSSENGTNNFQLILNEISGNLVGQHCSIYYNGTKIDCVDGNTSIKLSETSNNIFEGTIKSAYSNSIGRIKLNFNPVSKKLYFYLIEKPSGINYIPKELILEQ